MTARLEILKKSLEKKQDAFDDKLNAHIKGVLRANGQPLNDKGAKGIQTLKKWEKQNDSLINSQKSIKKTELAIEREQFKINVVNNALSQLPAPIVDMFESGELIQWRKYPHIFFVAGVERARILYDFNNKTLSHKYVGEIKNKDQFNKFKETFNGMKNRLENQPTE